MRCSRRASRGYARYGQTLAAKLNWKEVIRHLCTASPQPHSFTRITGDGLKARPHLTQVDVFSTIQRIAGDGLEDANEFLSTVATLALARRGIKNIDYP